MSRSLFVRGKITSCFESSRGVMDLVGGFQLYISVVCSTSLWFIYLESVCFVSACPGLGSQVKFDIRLLTLGTSPTGFGTSPTGFFALQCDVLELKLT